MEQTPSIASSQGAPFHRPRDRREAGIPDTGIDVDQQAVLTRERCNGGMIDQAMGPAGVDPTIAIVFA